jgi:large subunit ribosomal protein L15
MILNDLKPTLPKKGKKRVGRGESSGQGKTSGKGHKGQNSRSGGGTRPGFEGGQMPIYKRVPKLKGFKNLFKKEFGIVNLSSLDKLDGTSFDIDVLKSLGLVRSNQTALKILGNGKLTRAIEVKASKFSKNAKEEIEALGGKALLVD